MLNKDTFNFKPISLREGSVFIDGLQAADSVKCEIVFTPDVWQGRQLGQRTQDSRWLGYAITGTITRRRSTPWMKQIVEKYKKTGITPEITIQGIMNDAESDYYAANGSDTVTAVGVVLTGGFNLLSLDSEGQVLDDNISFNAKDIL